MNNHPDNRASHPRIQSVQTKMPASKSMYGYTSADGKHKFKRLIDLADYGFRYFWSKRGFDKPPPTITSHLIGTFESDIQADV